jgi:hypothetical protein
MNPTEKLYDTFYFREPVLGQESCRPESWSGGKDGYTFEMVIDDEVVVKVTVPKSNILYTVDEQHWLAEGQTVEGFYEDRRLEEEARRERRREMDRRYGGTGYW